MRGIGEMPEWSNGTDSKSVVLATVPRVQIPISPPYVSEKALINQGFFVSVFQKKITAHTLAHTSDGIVFATKGMSIVGVMWVIAQSNATLASGGS